ncbi:hypothetical protein DPMN_100854 [Dreissena polymorpha]|uniref:Uncharacterized protein n=1 Tax=Dreissena polymorpha TaxID=45954 RepID=A0A9D4LI67_DREPO|nr:hypothetical protein DPMN_100854 [Dreissena polymorpha]
MFNDIGFWADIQLGYNLIFAVKLRPRMTNRALPPLSFVRLNVINDDVQYITHSIFHQDWTINVASRVLTRKNAPTPGGHVFKPTGINFELVQDIKGIFSRFGKLTKLKKVISDS